LVLISVYFSLFCIFLVLLFGWFLFYVFFFYTAELSTPGRPMATVAWCRQTTAAP